MKKSLTYLALGGFLMLSYASFAACDKDCPCACHKEKAQQNITVEILKPVEIVETTVKEVVEKPLNKEVQDAVPASDIVKEVQPLKETTPASVVKENTAIDKAQEVAADNIEEVTSKVEEATSAVEEIVPVANTEETTVQEPSKTDAVEASNAPEDSKDEVVEQEAKKCPDDCACGCHKKFNFFKKVKCNCNK